jgi:hypothetical protein
LYVLGDLVNQFFITPHPQDQEPDTVTASGNNNSIAKPWPKWNPEQTLKFALTGTLLHGPYFLVGFRALDHWFPGQSLTLAIKKTLIGQTLLFPPFVGLFLSFSGLLNDQPPLDLVKARFVELNKNGLLVWPAANIINFKFVPQDYRVAYVSLIGLGWNTYLSWMLVQEKKRQKLLDRRHAPPGYSE